MEDLPMQDDGCRHMSLSVSFRWTRRGFANQLLPSNNCSNRGDPICGHGPMHLATRPGNARPRRAATSILVTCMPLRGGSIWPLVTCSGSSTRQCAKSQAERRLGLKLGRNAVQQQHWTGSFTCCEMRQCCATQLSNRQNVLYDVLPYPAEVQNGRSR
jgi:hypothetical protein